MKELALCQVATLVNSSNYYGWDEWEFQDDFTLCTWHRNVKAFELSNGDVVIYEREYDILWDNEIVYSYPQIYSEDGTIYIPTTKETQEEVRQLKEVKHV